MRGSHDYDQKIASIFSNTKTEDFVKQIYHQGYTPIFEYCAPDIRIVVNYKTTSLTLLSIRHRVNGHYLSRQEVEVLAKQHQIPVVKPLLINASSSVHLVSEVRKITGAEGCVIAFDDDHMVKLKATWYTQLHKLISYFHFEKSIALLILSNNQDDLLGMLSDERKQSLITYQTELIKGLKNLVKQCEEISEQIIEKGTTRKEFATDLTAYLLPVKSAIFKHFDNLSEVDFFDELVQNALTQTNTIVKWEKFKQISNLELNWDVAPIV